MRPGDKHERTVLIVTTLAFAALTVVMLAAARNTLFPPVLFAGTWLLTLVGLIAFGGTLYDVGDYGYLVFLVGACAFCCGGLLTLCVLPHPDSGAPRPRNGAPITRAALDILLGLLVASFPYYVGVAFRIAGTSETAAAVLAIRRAVIEAEGDANPFGAVAGNLNVLAGLVAIALVYEADGTWRRRWRAIAGIVVALAYGALTGTKGGALLLVTFFFAAQIRVGKIKMAAGLGAIAIALTFFAVGLLAINLPGRSFEDVRTAAGALSSTFISYWLGPLVSFGQIAEQPDALASSENIGRFFLQTARSLGLDVTLPSLYEKYTPISADMTNNTYTIYFSYFKDYGWLGMALLLASLGVFLTILWARALRGFPVAVLMYAMMCKAIVQSFFNEAFFLGLNGYIKAYVLYWFLYRLLPSIGGQQEPGAPAAARSPAPA